MTTVTTAQRPQRTMALEMEIARRLSAQYGRITSSRGGEYILPDGTQPPPDVIQTMRNEIEVELNRIDIKHETSLRIVAVMKDIITQINIAMWLAQADPEKDKADIDMARKLVKWIAAVRETGRKLAKSGDRTFSDNSHWPAPPANAQKFINRF